MVATLWNKRCYLLLRVETGASIFMALRNYTYTIINPVVFGGWKYLYRSLVLYLLQFLLPFWPDHSLKRHFHVNETFFFFSRINKGYINITLPKTYFSFYLVTETLIVAKNDLLLLLVWWQICLTDDAPASHLQLFKWGKSFFFFWQIPEIAFWHNTRLLLHADGWGDVPLCEDLRRCVWVTGPDRI